MEHNSIYNDGKTYNCFTFMYISSLTVLIPEHQFVFGSLYNNDNDENNNTYGSSNKMIIITAAITIIKLLAIVKSLNAFWFNSLI